MMNGEDLPWMMNSLEKKPAMIAPMIPIAYMMKATTPPWIAPPLIVWMISDPIAIKIGSLAPQAKNGVREIVSSFSLWLSIVLVPMMPGTAQPKQEIRGTTQRPEIPKLRSNLSKTKATLDI